MPHILTIFLTGLAPIIWGSTYVVTTELLPEGYPLTVSLLRALPAGLLMLLIVRKLPGSVRQWVQIFILGALNFTLFWYFLFEAAYRLPGGIAATVGSFQPLIVIFLSWVFLKQKLNIFSIFAAALGVVGVSLLVITPTANFDGFGLLAGAGGALSMAFGTVLSRYWQPDVSPFTFTAWQLTAGGILLIPVSLILEPALPMPTMDNMIGYTYLGLIGAALTYILWFNGIAKLAPSEVSLLGFLSPMAAVLLGWVLLDQTLDSQQISGFVLVMGSVWLGQMGPMLLKKMRRQPAVAGGD